MESCELNTSIFRCLKLRKLEMKNKIYNGIKQFFIRIVGCRRILSYISYLDLLFTSTFIFQMLTILYIITKSKFVLYVLIPFDLLIWLFSIGYPIILLIRETKPFSSSKTFKSSLKRPRSSVYISQRRSYDSQFNPESK